MTIQLRRTEPQGVIWVCDCCTLTRENGECCEDHARHSDGLWSRERDTEVTHGMMYEWHACGKSTDDNGYDCDCEIREMVRSSCDGCGNRLHGTRHAYTWWA